MIKTTRLRLVPIRAEVLTSLIKGDVQAAGELQGFTFSSAFLDSVNEAFLTIQLKSIESTPSGEDWGVRAIVLEAGGEVIGHCGFHGPPEAVGRAEVGYTIFPEYRNHGYASEAVTGLINVARENGSKIVYAAVSPENSPSIRVLEKVGFLRTGAQENNGGAEEYVFEMNL
ncbi:MAG TPA: GNAT family N-acetyltransferase [Acidimicrobiales bacterium]|nr:GNAT family N-acetyltransferase [Acidimicrobiales bacterium]